MSAKLISGIRIQGLFGLYDYCLPESGEFSNATIFYGDNGVGKSTLLRLVFHLLSPARNKGHRNALYAADFENFEVDLASGIKLTARFHKGLPIRILSLAIFDKDNQLAAWDYFRRSQQNLLSDTDEAVVDVGQDGHARLKKRDRLDDKRIKDKIPRGMEAYIETLATVVPTLFILNAERRLDSDSVADPSDEIELRRLMRLEQGKRISELAVRSREIALSQALSAATKWINRNAVLGANQGSMNVHSVYVTVLQHILHMNAKKSDVPPENTASELLEQLSKIEKKTAEHARYELATELSTVELQQALCASEEEKRKLAATLLRPYIESLAERLRAVEHIYITL
jgi:energy-coupling factor transporter ATP-binding protein EcfA2